MNNNPLISLIIPVYNGSKHLKRTIDCVFTQTYQNIEFIAINDGSTDNSLDILKDAKEKCPPYINMIIIDRENKGICHTRNDGLDIAKGEYIMFMDQDDTIENDCIEKLYEIICQDNDYGIAIGGYNLKSPEGNILDIWKLDPNEIYSPYRNPAPWGRLYRRDIINKNHLRFMNIKISEDFYFNFVYMSYCKKIAVTSYIGYAWYLYPNSESHSKMSILSKDRNPLVMLTKLHKDIHSPNIFDNYCFEYMVSKHIFWYLLFTAKSAESRELIKAKKACISWLTEYYPSYRNNPYIKIFGKRLPGEAKKINRIVRLCVFLERIGLLSAVITLYSKL